MGFRIGAVRLDVGAEFKGILLLGDERTGKSLAMKKVVMDLEKSGLTAIYSKDGITDDMKVAIKENVFAIQKCPLYLVIDNAEKLDESFDIVGVINTGSSNQIAVILGYNFLAQVPDRVRNACFTKFEFYFSKKERERLGLSYAGRGPRRK